MASARVTLRGRFSPGTVVRLVQVRDASVLRAEGGREVDTKKVDKDGVVQFSSGVQAGARYFIVGQQAGEHLEVRATGKPADEDTGLAQAPVGTVRTKFADGSWSDERLEERDAPFAGSGPHPAVEQARGRILRSDTLRGSAHPVEPEEPAPYPGQDEVSKGTVQRSDTETGQATPVAHQAPHSQTDVKKGTVQRSDTPFGVATPIPKGDLVDAQLLREAAETKASVGEPGKAAALPPNESPKVRDRDEDPAVVVTPDAVAEAAVESGNEGDGRDAQGQPLDEGVAAAAGVEPADSPAEPVRRRRSKPSKKS